MKFSNKANRRIGLPQTDSLILRSAYITPGTRLSEPALLIDNLNSPQPTYNYLDENVKTKLASHKEFTNFLRPNTHLLIHDDNYDLQRGGIHVRTTESISGAELFFGTDALQTRELEMETKKRPSIRINISHPPVSSHYKMAELFNIDPADIERMCDEGIGYLEKNGKSIRLRNIDKAKALKLVHDIKKDKEALLEAHNIGQEMKGERAVVESRIYRKLPGGQGRRVQALDID